MIMPGASFDRWLDVKDVDRAEVRFTVQKPWEQYQPHLQQLIPPEIYASDLWTSPHALKVQQLLTNGPCFTVTPKGFVTASHWLASKHAEYLRGDGVKGAKADQNAELICQSLRAGFGTSPNRVELFFVPVNAVSGKLGKVVPTFLGYLVHEGATLLADGFVRNTQLPVVLDLDETLLVANSLSQLESQMAKAKESRRQLDAEAATVTAPEDRQALEERQDVLTHEIQSLDEDRRLLKQYRDSDTVVDPRAGAGAQVERARYETAKLDDGSHRERPVVRLHGGVVLTRIDPNNRDTSMIMRIRPGWESLRAFLAPELSKGHPRVAKQWKRRFDVYVCTAAERGYALEAWRLLDSNNDIIPDNIRSVRVVCVPGGQKKELRRVFRIQAPIMYQSEEAPAEAACAMPLAMIVDDRLDVWEPESQAQVLQVAPFAPHRPTALGEGQMGNSLVRQAMVDEMGLVKHRMTAIRGYVYHDVNNKLSPAIDKLMKKGQPLDLFAADISNVLPPVRSVSTLLKVPNLSIDDLAQQTQAAAAAGAPSLATAPSFGVSNPSLQPQDPRQARRGPWPVNQGQPQPGAPFAAALQPVDPRKAPRAVAPRQPLPSATGAMPHQPSASGPPGTQVWRPSPSFQQQQQQLQQAAVPGARLLSHQLSNGSITSDRPKDPRRARQPQQQLSSLGPSQQLPQQLPQPSHGGALGQQVPLQPAGSGHQGMTGLQQPVRPGLQQTASGIPGTTAAGAAAAKAASVKVLDLDLAVAEIRLKMRRPNYNAISLVKEAADKQKVDYNIAERTIPPHPGRHLPAYQAALLWQGQEIGIAIEGDKKTAKNRAAQRGIEFMLQYTPPVLNPLPNAALEVAHPQPQPQPSSSGTSGGPSEGQGTSGQVLIKEDNALSQLQHLFPKEVKYANKPVLDGSGRYCEVVDCWNGDSVARGTTSSKQTSKRWAAMRLLQELGLTIDPAFFRNTPEGVRQRSKGPSQDEFHRATQVLFVRGRPFARRNQPSTPQQTQHAQQSQQAEHAWQIQLAGQAQHVQQAQHAQQLQGGNRQVGPGATANPQHPQAQQQQQGTLNSNRGQKRFAASEAVPALHPSKRSKNADEVGHKHTMAQADCGHPNNNESDDAAKDAKGDDGDSDEEDAGNQELVGDGDDGIQDDPMDDDQADDPRDMSMEPPEQSGYPADPGDEAEEKYGESPSERLDLTAQADMPVSRQGRMKSYSKVKDTEVITVSDGSVDDGSENVGAHSVEPEGSITMQGAHDSTFLAAVKKQSKVKEGDWMEVRRQSNSGDYGLIDID